jgi:hypothetical protein
MFSGSAGLDFIVVNPLRESGVLTPCVGSISGNSGSEVGFSLQKPFFLSGTGFALHASYKKGDGFKMACPALETITTSQAGVV